MASEEREAMYRRALYDLVTAHNGYNHGVGPCICAAHENARRLLGMNRDDAMPDDLRRASTVNGDRNG